MTKRKEENECTGGKEGICIHLNVYFLLLKALAHVTKPNFDGGEEC